MSDGSMARSGCRCSRTRTVPPEATGSAYCSTPNMPMMSGMSWNRLSAPAEEISWSWLNVSTVPISVGSRLRPSRRARFTSYARKGASRSRASRVWSA